MPEFPGPWAILRMLDQCHLKGRQGYVKLPVKVKSQAESDEPMIQVLFLKLEFFEDSEGKNPLEFPNLDEWPPLEK